MPSLSWNQLDNRRSRRKLAQRHRDRRAVAVLAVVSLFAAIVAVVPFAFSGGGAGDVAPAEPLTESPFAGSGPANIIVARAAGIDLRLPVASDRLTAVVLGSSDNPTARRLDPGEGVDVIRTGATSDAAGPPSSAMSIGAPAGTPVYSPIDGVVASVSPNLVAGEELGFQITLQPSSQSSAAIRVTNLTAPDGARPQLGEPVSAGSTALGQVIDLSGVVRLSMSRFTADGGHHIQLEVVDSGESSGA